MTGDPTVDAAIERYHAAAAEFIKGNVEPYKALFSQTDDVCLANPSNPVARGWAEASDTMERACALYAEGEVVGFDRIAQHVTAELAYVMEIDLRSRCSSQARVCIAAERARNRGRSDPSFDARALRRDACQRWSGVPALNPRVRPGAAALR